MVLAHLLTIHVEYHRDAHRRPGDYLAITLEVALVKFQSACDDVHGALKQRYSQHGSLTLSGSLDGLGDMELAGVIADAVSRAGSAA